MQSADPSHLFQSDASLRIGASRAEKAARTREGSEWGAPIWLGHEHEDVEKLATGGAGADGGAAKVLQLIVLDDLAWTAESGGIARATHLETGETLQMCRGHTAPVSSLAMFLLPSGRRLLLTGSWDKSVRAWPLAPASRGGGAPSLPRAFAVIDDAGSDFIKALLCLDSHEEQLLISGGSDRNVRVWDLANLATWADQLPEDVWNGTGKCPAPPSVPCVATMREHTRPISELCSLAPMPGTSASEQADSGTPLFSADTMGRVLEARLHVRREDGACKARYEIRRELRGNQTGVFALATGWRGIEEEDTESEEPTYTWTPELWTGSHDNTAQLFVLDNSVGPSSGALAATSSVRSQRNLAQVGNLPPLLSSRTITHPIYVKSLLITAHLPQRAPSLVVPDVLLTGSTDEQIRAWDLSEKTSLSATSSTRRHLNGQPVEALCAGARLLRETEGHWHEVTALAPWWRTGGDVLESEEKRLKLEERVGDKQKRNHPAWWIVSASLDGSLRRWKLSDLILSQVAPDIKAAATVLSARPAKKIPGSSMTEEEERELAELLDDD